MNVPTFRNKWSHIRNDRILQSIKVVRNPNCHQSVDYTKMPVIRQMLLGLADFIDHKDGHNIPGNPGPLQTSVAAALRRII
jgi:hypothetical protein